MKGTADLRTADGRLAKRAISWDARWARRLLLAAEDAAENTKLWWAAAAAMATVGGRRGRRAAAAGVAGMAVAQFLSNAVAKKLYDRRRPPKEWVPAEDLEDRPDSSSFPSGHTAAAVAFTGAVAPTWPSAAAACTVPAALVAAERIHSGAHYPSDVAVGGVIGLTSAALARAAPRLNWQHKLRRRAR